jgi:hypothetical protein
MRGVKPGKGVNVEVIIVVVADQDPVDAGQGVEGDAGAVTRAGPANLVGETRVDQTGSVRMLRPATWINIVA